MIPGGVREFCYRQADNAVFVPPGPFWQGCIRAKELDVEWCNASSWDAVRAVTTAPYLVQRTPVTQSEYRDCAEAQNGCSEWPFGYTEEWDWYPAFGEVAIGGITTSEAERYCEWLGEKSKVRWRLCSNSEWEKAARGGCETLPGGGDLGRCAEEVRLYPWGDEYPECEIVTTIRGCDLNEANTPGYAWGLPVGSDPQAAGPYGVLDMWGTDLELVADCFPVVPTPPSFPPTDGSAWDHDCRFEPDSDGVLRPIRYVRGGGYGFNPLGGSQYPLSVYHPLREYGEYGQVLQFRCCADFDQADE
ncbi:MAG: SUMF1/EgtB/PvdO family nonheme iron enzyme [Myxococcota bacterium]